MDTGCLAQRQLKRKVQEFCVEGSTQQATVRSPLPATLKEARYDISVKLLTLNIQVLKAEECAHTGMNCETKFHFMLKTQTALLE